jgi:hypothetical protein
MCAIPSIPIAFALASTLPFMPLGALVLVSPMAASDRQGVKRRARRVGEKAECGSPEHGDWR